MGQTFIGFYWTLPVKWAGIFKLPTKPGQKSYDAVNEAAAASRTIYYQRELVKRYIFEQHGHNGRLDREFVYMEADPDRVSEGIREVIDIIAPLCARKDEQGKSKLLYVNFADMDEASSPNWRRHNELNHYVKSKHIEALGLSPKPIRLRDKRFDPIEILTLLSISKIGEGEVWWIRPSAARQSVLAWRYCSRKCQRTRSICSLGREFEQ